MFETKGFQPRTYQETILDTAIRANTLICLPTGRGKTKTALLVAIHRLNNFPNSKIIFLTPTKPLASQITEEFRENSTIPAVNMFTGGIKPEKREQLFKESRVIVSTPQGMSNDIINKKIDLRDVSLMVFDECHRAVKEYDYVWIAKQYNKVGNYPRIVGMSASPGSDLETINEVCQNLHIEEIEVRNDEDEDVKPYVKNTKVVYTTVELPGEFKQAQKYLTDCYKERLKILKEFGLCGSISSVSKTMLLRMQKELQQRIARGERDPAMWKTISVVAQAMKILHAQEQFETQGIKSAYQYMKKLFREAETTNVKATKNLVIDTNFKSAYYKISTMYELETKHPKLIKLKEIISKEIKTCDKILIFTNYRNSATNIRKELEDIEEVNSAIFVGQTKKAGTGLSQKEQIQVLKDFKEGVHNIIIGTSVGEEGIDIPSVDLIIFYEPVPSAIRTVQRRGRTGRMKDGRVQVLVTKGTRDEAYRWTAHHKENRMHRILKELKSKLTLSRPKNETLDTFIKKRKLKIYADSRERGSGVIKCLVDNDIEVRMQNLNVGDFLVSERTGIERKEVRDFVDSIIDKRLLSQVSSLKKTFERPLLIIEGMEDLYSVRKVHPNAIRGMLAWIAIDMKIPILYTKDFRDTAELLIVIAKREQQENEKDFGIRGERKPLSTKELQEYIISGLPGVGPSLAKNLLDTFTTVRKIMNTSEEELKDVEKIGKKKAAEIQRILDEEYKE